jgi:uncharacterized heparinase superfamily protein
MYHQIILDRLLDCINLLENNHVFGDEQDSLLFLMKDRAGIMLGWINYMTFESGDIPMVNDSAPAIAPLTRELNEYASRKGLLSQSSVPLPISNLKESGYRRFNGANYECMVDVGEIRPDFQPGHSHAGTFSFVVQYQNKPFIVDTGVSTYEKNARRAEERSTSAHNTVQVQNKNSSQVWGGFRVGRRAKIKLLQEDNFQIVAQHDGYKPVFVHERKFNFQPYKIEISDQDALKGTMILTARIHFHPDVNCKVTGNMVVCDNIKLEFNGHSSLKISEYMFAAQFNQLKPSKMVEIIFDSQLKTTISF